jgi:hypothetical protein
MLFQHFLPLFLTCLLVAALRHRGTQGDPPFLRHLRQDGEEAAE